MDTQQYRPLAIGEVIQEGDEWESGGMWSKVAYTVGETYRLTPSATLHSYHRPHRRPIVSHRPSDLPDDLPDPPAPPEGTRWVYRGKNFKSKKNAIYAYFWREDKKWNVWNSPSHTNGMTSDYLEAVPLEPAKEIWTFSSNNWNQVETSPLHAENQALREQIVKLKAQLAAVTATADHYEANCVKLTEKLENIRAAVAQR